MIEDTELFKELIKDFREIFLKEIIKTCLTCEFWNNDPENCSLYGERPPAHIIVTSCESWRDKTE